MTEKQQAIMNWAFEGASDEMINSLFNKWAKTAYADVMKDMEKRRSIVAGRAIQLELFGEFEGVDVGGDAFEKILRADANEAMTSKHYAKNVISLLKKNHLDKDILSVTGETSLAEDNFEYLGGSVYQYMGMFIISFQNSPLSIEMYRI